MDRPIESCLVSRYLLIHEQGLDSTQPNLQRGAIATSNPIQETLMTQNHINNRCQFYNYEIFQAHLAGQKVRSLFSKASAKMGNNHH